jgi:hypothetical protein
MSRELDKVRKTRNASVTVDAVEERAVTERGVTERGLTVAPMLFSNLGDLFTLRYSSTEVFSEDGELHVKMKETRYRDGRITSEECEGTLDRQAYDRLLEQTQGYFLQQAAGFMRLLYAPFLHHNRRDGE